MNLVVQKMTGVWPELVLLVGGIICLITGVSKSQTMRKFTVWAAATSLVAAGLLINLVSISDHSYNVMSGFVYFFKLAAVFLGLILLMIAANTPDSVGSNRQTSPSGEFLPGSAVRGEFFAFFLFSITGLMLTAGAGDLVWLLLALELTSLPTYIMIALSSRHIDARESSVKYFFLGAVSVAIFLFGFTFIYGATGFTDFDHIREAIRLDLVNRGGCAPLMLVGLVLAILGISFKIAAVPMHFHVADVYQGASSAVAAFLAFVPKAAGFAALILLLQLVGSPLPEPVAAMLWALAVLTMTVGNVLALLQDNVKRLLAYSSIAHSGYMLAGLLAGMQVSSGVASLGNGIAAVLFYLVAYGLASSASFAVLSCFADQEREAQTLTDITGLGRRYPLMAGVMIVSILSLIGLPPLVGFVGKIQLIGSTFQAGFAVLAVILVLNSAVSAAYYLRIVSACFFSKPSEQIVKLPSAAGQIGAVTAAVFVIYLGMMGGQLVKIALMAVVP